MLDFAKNVNSFYKKGSNTTRYIFKRCRFPAFLS